MRTDCTNKQLINLTSCCYLKSDGQIFLGENRLNISMQHNLFFFFFSLRKVSQGFSMLAACMSAAVQHTLQSLSYSCTMSTAGGPSSQLQRQQLLRLNLLGQFQKSNPLLKI